MKKQVLAQDPEVSEHQGGGVAQALAIVALVAIGVTFLFDSHGASSLATSGDFGPSLVPFVLAVTLLIFTGTLALSMWRHRDTSKAPGSRLVLRRSAGTYALLTFGYLLLIEPLGFFVALSLFIVVTCLVAGIGPWLKIGCITIGMNAFAYFVFTVGLSILFP